MTVERPLSQIATITMGTSPKGDTYNLNGEGLPLLNGPTEFGSVHPKCTLFTTKSVRKGQAGDLIFCVRGSTTGRMNWADRVYSLGRGVCSIRGQSASETRFVKYCLDWKLESLLKLAGGGTFPNLTQDTIRNFEIPFPESRRKIAAILSAYDGLIENNLRRIKILEEMAQNLYCEWFVKFRFPGHQHIRFTYSPLGQIPEGWECGIVNDLLSLKSGFAFKSSIFTEGGTYGLVTIKNVHDGLFVPECTSKIADLPSNMPSFCHLSTGDVLLSLTGNIGRVCLVYGADYLLNQRVAKLVPIEANNRAYTYFTFRQDEFQTKLSKIANGVAQQNLSPIETGRMQVVIPSQKVLSDFAGICEPMVEEMTTLFRKNYTLRRTRDLLLPRLISGEVDVSELDITIPEEAA